jgi:hypothetical protein
VNWRITARHVAEQSQQDGFAVVVIAKGGNMGWRRVQRDKQGHTNAGARHAYLEDSTRLRSSAEKKIRHCRCAYFSANLIAFEKAKMTIN